MEEGFLARLLLSTMRDSFMAANEVATIVHQMKTHNATKGHIPLFTSDYVTALNLASSVCTWLLDNMSRRCGREVEYGGVYPFEGKYFLEVRLQV